MQIVKTLIRRRVLRRQIGVCTVCHCPNYGTLGINEINYFRDENSLIANSVDIDEVAHHEPPHQGLHCLPSNL